MTIDKAIEILKGTPGPEFVLQGKQAWEACQLGIEALKRVKAYKEAHVGLHYTPLPGEEVSP